MKQTQMLKFKPPVHSNQWSMPDWKLRRLHKLIIGSPSITTVLELGCGVSTQVLANLLNEPGCQLERAYSIDHLDWYAEQQLKLEPIAKAVADRKLDITISPLSELGQYRLDEFFTKSLSTCQLVIVDGPPRIEGIMSRYQNLKRLPIATGSLILLDDTERKEEASLIARWATQGARPIAVWADGRTNKQATLLVYEQG